MWVEHSVHLSLSLGVQVRGLAVVPQPLPLICIGKSHLNALSSVHLAVAWPICTGHSLYSPSSSSEALLRQSLAS